MIRRSLRLGIALAVVCCATAQAHAVLERTTPSQGATLRSQPASVAFYFDESVEASFGAVRVVDANGQDVQTGEVFRPQDHSDAVAIGLRPDLPDGSYTATYRVLSADSHPVAGGFVFSIGEPTAGGGESVSAVLDQGGSGGATSVAFWADRWLGYLAIGLGVGALLFGVLVGRPALAAVAGAGSDWTEAVGGLARRLRRLIAASIAVGLAASLLALPLEVANVSGVSFWSALDPELIGEITSTRFGTVLLARAAAWALLGVVLAVVVSTQAAPLLRRVQLGATGVVPTARVPALALVAAGVPAAFLVLSPALAGHATTQSPEALLLPSDVIHVAAMTLWLGGLASLVIALPAATRALATADRTRLLLASLSRFSPLALGAVIALGVTGTIQAVIEVGSVPALVDTGFGRAVLAKIVLLSILIGLGAANRRRLLPALARLAAGSESPGRIGVALRRNLRVETVLIGVVLAVTAVLVGYAPANQSTAGPVSGQTTIGPAVLEYTVDPARVGANRVHLYLFDADDGTQYTQARALDLSASEPEREIGPLAIDLRKAGPGHYVAPEAQLGAPGDWQLKLTMRTSRFAQSEARLEVPVQ